MCIIPRLVSLELCCSVSRVLNAIAKYVSFIIFMLYNSLLTYSFMLRWIYINFILAGDSLGRAPRMDRPRQRPCVQLIAILFARQLLHKFAGFSSFIKFFVELFCQLFASFCSAFCRFLQFFEGN